MSKERELLARVLGPRTFMQGVALRREIEELLAQPHKNRLIEVYTDFLKSLIENDGAGLKELKAFDIETYNKLKATFGVSDLLAQSEQDPVTNEPTATAMAVMPNGVSVSNVYDAYEEGRKSVMVEQEPLKKHTV